MYRLLAGVILALASSTVLQAQFQPGSLPPSVPAATLKGPLIVPQVIGPQSHHPEQGKQELEDFRRWLLGKNKKNVPDNIDPELLKKLMEKLPKDKKVDQQQLEKMFQDNPQLKDTAFLLQLEKLLQSKDFPNNLEDKFPKDQKPPKLSGDDLEKLKKVIESGTKHGDPKIGEDGGDPSKGTTPAKSPYEDNKWVKWFEENFKDSPAANDAMKDLLTSLEKNNGKGMFDEIPELKNGGWKDINNWGKNNAGDFWKGKPPEINGGKMTLPKMNNSGGGSSWGGSGSSGGGSSGFGSPSGASFEGGSTVLVVLAVAAAAIFIGILLLRKWKDAKAGEANQVGIGPLYIDFDAIRSRKELVRVFNTVSLDKCGDEARNWNHRVIADQLVEAQPTYLEPANEVAELYERARYAPTDEDLTQREFSDARRDLRTIAGVPS